MSAEQKITDQFLEAWRNAKDETTRKEILQEVTNIVPETLIPHFIDWLDDAPPLEMFNVIVAYKENWETPFLINITRNDTLRPKLIHWLEKIIQAKGILDEIELSACELIIYFGRKSEEFDFVIIHLEEIYKKLLIPKEIREKAYTILWRLQKLRNILASEQQDYLDNLIAGKEKIKLFEDWSWSTQNKNYSGQRNILRGIYVDNKLKKKQFMLPVLLGWLQECLAPQAMTWALDAYIPDIIANDAYRKQVMAYFVSQPSAESPPQAMPATGKFNFKISTSIDSKPKSNADTLEQRQVACFIEEIATTPEELSPVITYYETVTRTFDPSEYHYELSVKHLRSLTVTKEALIPADVYTRLLLFLESIPAKPMYDVKYHLSHPANTHWGRICVDAEDEGSARSATNKYLSNYNDGPGGSSGAIIWMVKIS